VKAGRRVRLVVSQGAVINRVESFLDRELAEVRKELPGRTSTLFVAEPVMYRQSDKPAGTILQQSPETGAALSGPAALHLVVSAGRGNAGTTVPGFAGLEPAGALERAGVAGLFLEFAAGEAGEGETAGTVIAQSPPEGASAGSDTRISLTVAAPAALQDGEVFGIFGYAMQELPFPLPVRLQAGLPSGNVVLLAELDFPGGWFSLPFTLPVGSVLTLSALGVAVHSEVVRG
ncbi:MAG: penicillin-binding protein, partial [Treponema sp.]|nr:penicillin-binding protein [Treponema sp.]